MRPCSRRSFLRASGLVALFVPFAGCSALDSGPGGVALGDVVIRNANPDPRSLRIELSRDDELVHEGLHTADGASDGVGAVEVVEATWSPTPAIYELTYVVRESESLNVETARITGDDVDSDDECAVPTITLGFPRASTIDFAVLGGDSGTKQYCPGIPG